MIRNSVHGYRQSVAVEYKLTNDDLLILRWFAEFSAFMKVKIIRGKPYYWLGYKHLLSSLPILNKQKQAVAKFNLQRLLDCNVLVRENVINASEIKGKSGKTSWFGFGENYINLLLDEEQQNFLENQEYKNTYDQEYKNTYDQEYKNTLNNTNKDITSNDKCVPRVRANADRLQPILSLIPNLSIDSKTIPTNFDATKVAEAIKKSNKFLINVKKLSFFLAHYDDILKGVFDDYGTGKVKDAQALVRRNYTQEQLDEIFADMDDYDKLDL